MPAYADVYVLALDRSAETVRRFIDRFASSHEETAADYCIPQHSSSPTRVLLKAADVIAYCVEHPREPQSVYLRCVGDGPAYAMIFFTADAGLILGLSLTEGEGQRWLAELQSFAGTKVGYVTFEAPPPATVAEFLEITTVGE